MNDDEHDDGQCQTMNETQICKVDAINFLVLKEDLKFDLNWIELHTIKIT